MSIVVFFIGVIFIFMINNILMIFGCIVLYFLLCFIYIERIVDFFFFKSIVLLEGWKFLF